MKERTNRSSSTNFLKVTSVFLFKKWKMSCDITKILAFGDKKGGKLL